MLNGAQKERSSYARLYMETGLIWRNYACLDERPSSEVHPGELIGCKKHTPLHLSDSVRMTCARETKGDSIYGSAPLNCNIVAKNLMGGNS
jgi:hypothetical protein